MFLAQMLWNWYTVDACMEFVRKLLPFLTLMQVPALLALQAHLKLFFSFMSPMLLSNGTSLRIAPVLLAIVLLMLANQPQGVKVDHCFVASGAHDI